MLFLVSCIFLGILGLVFGLLLAYSKKHAVGDDSTGKIDTVVDEKQKDTHTEEVHALLCCQGSVTVSPECATYNGIATCRASAVLYGPHKACSFGCLGFGDCVRVCPTSAIEMDSTTHLPVIESSQCTACGKCATVCPRSLIAFVPHNKDVHILCSSHANESTVTQWCSKGCSACGVCETVCPVHAITITENLPHIDYATCTNCGICAGKCPTQAILYFFSLKHA